MPLTLLLVGNFKILTIRAYVRRREEEEDATSRSHFAAISGEYSIQFR